MPQGPTPTSTGQFQKPELYLTDLESQATARLLSAAADVVLILDDTGVVRDLAIGSEEMLADGQPDWLGRAWADTVTPDSKPKIEAMLRDAGAGQAVRWRHVNHSMGDGAELPVAYSLMPLRRIAAKGRGAARAHLVAFGRDLRPQATLQQRLVSAQQSMERDYWRLRHVETRYRLLFQVTSEAVLVLDARTEKLEEANTAAHELLGGRSQRSGWTLADSLDAASHEALRQVFERLRVAGRTDPVTLRLADGGAQVVAHASVFRQENTNHFLLRLQPHDDPRNSAVDEAARLQMQVLERSPDALALTDLDGRILTVNAAFLSLAQLGHVEQARGESLDNWLGRGVDLNVLLSNLRQRGAVRLFATQMRGNFGSTTEVEISAVSVPDTEPPCLGFWVRDVGRRLPPQDTRGARALPRSAGQMTELVGRVPLKDIVRETTDLIEQLCIEAALQLTGDNRASAAEMLGLSRQSLYVKLRRFGIGDTEALAADGST